MQCQFSPHHPVRFQVKWKFGFHWPAKLAIIYQGSCFGISSLSMTILVELLFSGWKSFYNRSNMAFHFFLEFSTIVSGDSTWSSGKLFDIGVM